MYLIRAEDNSKPQKYIDYWMNRLAPKLIPALDRIIEEKLKDLRQEAVRKELWQSFKIERPDTYKSIIKQHPEWEDSLPQEMIDNMINEDSVKLEVDPGKNNVLISMLDSVPPAAELLLGRTWHFLFASDGSEFITSDVPAFVAIPTIGGAIHFKYGGFGRSDAVIFFPVSKNICALISGTTYGQLFSQASAQRVLEINRMIASRPLLTHIISSSERLVEQYSKFQSIPHVML
jgi:hypothetical protein